MLNFKSFQNLTQIGLIQNDQAAGLRRIMLAPKPRVVSILSASSAQDQAHLITNLAVSIGMQGNDVLIVHASQNTRESSYDLKQLPTLLDVSQEKAMLIDVVKESKHGFSAAKLMPKNQLNNRLCSNSHHLLSHTFNELALQYDIVLVDVSLNNEHLLPLKTLNEGEVVIKLTRQSESIKDAYALIKQVCNQLGRRSFGIIVDNATDSQAQIVFRNISEVARRFMQIELEFFGAIPADDHLNRAAKLGRTVIDAFPLASASTALKQIAQRLDYKQDYATETRLATNF